MLNALFTAAQMQRSRQEELAAERSARTALDAVRGVRDLQDRVDRLTLVSMALWSLLREHTDMTEEDLMARAVQIDLSDGREDGKVRVKVYKCTNCGRTLAQRHRKCLYCGAAKPNASAFGAAL